MHDSEGMQRLDTKTHLCENLENHLLLEHLVFVTHVSYSMGQVPTVRILHHKATSSKRIRTKDCLIFRYLPQTARGFIDKGSLVWDDIGMLNTRQVTNLSQCVVFFTFARRLVKLDDLQCILLHIVLIYHLVDRAVSALPDALSDLVVCKLWHFLMSSLGIVVAVQGLTACKHRLLEALQ